MLLGISAAALVALQQPARADEGMATSSQQLNLHPLCAHDRVADVVQGAWCDCWHWLHAESGAMQIFYGLAAPPTSYGGYGGNAKEAAKCALFVLEVHYDLVLMSSGSCWF